MMAASPESFQPFLFQESKLLNKKAATIRHELLQFHPVGWFPVSAWSLRTYAPLIKAHHELGSTFDVEADALSRAGLSLHCASHFVNWALYVGDGPEVTRQLP